jgi:hypothetical protein
MQLDQFPEKGFDLPKSGVAVDVRQLYGLAAVDPQINRSVCEFDQAAVDDS